MPYTNPWVDNIPLGSEPANNIDDFMRRLRLDVHERMDDIVEDWEADPVVPKSQIGLATHGVAYLNNNDPGDKSSDYQPIVTLLSISYIGSTTFGGVVVLNLNEINILTETTDYQVSDLYLPMSLPTAFVGRKGDSSGSISVRNMQTDDVANTITLILDNLSSLASVPVRFIATFSFLTSPVIPPEEP